MHERWDVAMFVVGVLIVGALVWSLVVMVRELLSGVW